jgi:CheY-like chemotaxis protein
MSRTLLLASDSLEVRRVFELAFPGEDMHVVAIADGRQAIDRIGADPPDMVVAEISLAGRDGYEVAAFVRESPHLAGIPVVLLADEFERVDEARAVGCAGVLVKPVQPQLAAARVRELLAARQPAAVIGRGHTTRPAGAGPPADRPAAPALEGDYLDRLDAAFAALSASPGPAARPAGAARPAPDRLEEPDPPSAQEGSEAPPAAAQPVPAFTVPDSLVDDIARRVIARLGDDQMRREVRIAAERLVQEEIDRIKGLRRHKGSAS